MAILSQDFSLEKNLSEFHKMLPPDGKNIKLTQEGIKYLLGCWNVYIQPKMEARLDETQSVQWVQYNDETGGTRLIPIYSVSRVMLEQEQITIYLMGVEYKLEEHLVSIKFKTQNSAKKSFDHLDQQRKDGKKKIIFIDN